VEETFYATLLIMQVTKVHKSFAEAQTRSTERVITRKKILDDLDSPLWVKFSPIKLTC
jgi:hypothetical protein